MASTSNEFAIIDSFTTTLFSGNPAAVCRLAVPRDTEWMQALAAELGMPATAFIYESSDGYQLRWFSTAAELALCGHGTLAAAHLLLDDAEDGTEVRFQTVAGPIACRRQGDWTAMDFPSEPPTPVLDPPAALVEALGVQPLAVARNRYDYLVELDSHASVRTLRLDIPLLLTVPTRGVIITARSDDLSADFVSRFFAVVLRGTEDSVTGSAHCALGPYWGAQFGKDELVGKQLSERGGVVRVHLRGERLDLLGQAVTVARGVLAN